MMKRSLSLLAACVLSAAAPLQSIRAQAVELSGTLHGVWRDATTPRGLTRLDHTLFTDDGRSLPVRVGDDVATGFGGRDALTNRRVRLSVESATGRVLAIRSVEPSDAEAGFASVFAGTPEPKPYLTLLCVFPDFPGVIPTTRAQAEVSFGTAYPGAAHFWNEVSDGRIAMTTVVRGWYTLPQPRSYYVNGSDALTNRISQDCATAADADVHFPDFAGINFVLNTDIGCCQLGGSGGLSLDGGPRGYAMTWLSGDVVTNIGHAAHEIGHSMGLQHSSGPYGLTYDSKWDVMSTGAWFTPAGTSYMIGAHINAFGKRQLGWIPDAKQFVATPGTHVVTIESTALPADNANYLMARIPAPRFGPATGQYYTLEARGLAGYDLPLPGAGIVIHRIGGGGITQSNVVDPDGNFDPSDLGAVFAPGETFADALNGVRVEVLERVGNAFRVSITLGDYPRVSIAEPLRTLSFAAGETGTVADSAALTIGGLGASPSWTARSTMPGPLVLTTTAGTGDGMLRWSIAKSGFGPGQYLQRIRATAGTVFAELDVRVTVTAPTALTAGLSLTSAHDSMMTDGVRTGGTLVRLSGTGASAEAWTATSTAPWIVIDSMAGTGNRLMGYRRNSAALAPGLHVGTIEIDFATATPSTIVFTDTLRVLEAPAWSVTQRGPARRALPQGGAGQLDSMFVGLNGRWATGGSWYVTQDSGDQYLRVESPTPIGSGWLRFWREPRELAPGSHPATFSLRLWLATEEHAFSLRDTLDILASASALVVSSPVARDSVSGIGAASEDSVFVQPQGPSSSTRVWSASTNSTRIFFPLLGYGIPSQRTGPSWFKWIRNLSGRAPGWHVDTVRFAFDVGPGTGTMVIDSLYVAAPPAPTAIALDVTSRRAELEAGSVVVSADSATVTTSGTNGAALAWTASKSRASTTLTTGAGTGTGRLRWTRSAAALAAGIHVDTIVVSAAAVGSPARIIDTLRVYAPLAVTSAAALTAGVMGANYALTLEASGGPTASRRWYVTAGALPAGIKLDSITGALGGTSEASGSFAFTVTVSAGAASAQRAHTLVITEPPLQATQVLNQLLGGGDLVAAQLNYLDLVGNRNGRLDIGDVRAWRQRQAAALTASDAAALDTLFTKRPPGGTP